MSGVMELARLHAEAAVRRHPFLRLARHFCGRATGTDSTSDLDFGVGGLLALLAIPGAFSSILLMDKYSSLLQFVRGQRHFDPFVACLPDEYFFIVYSMAITGLITLLRWDQLLPDKRDFANLGTLPLALWKIFSANVVALAALAGLFAIDINLVSALVFPMLVTIQIDKAAVFFEVVFAHALATIGISAFTFLALLALQGLLMAMLPDSLYRRVALTSRTALLILLTGTLISVFVFPLSFLQVNFASAKNASGWPPLWFLGLFESHVTELQNRAGADGGLAWRALGLAAVLAICGFSLSYKRYFLKIPERQTELSKQRTRTFRPALLLFRPALRTGFETACFHFIWRTLTRNETHLLFAGLGAGIGALLSMQGLRLHAAQAAAFNQLMVIAPLTFTLFTLGGIRFVFDIASAAQANWVFRLIAEEKTNVVRSACRKLLLFVGITPLVLIWFPAAVWQAGWATAAGYLWFHALTIPMLVEILLWKFQKIPFTCSLAPSRDRFLKIVIGMLAVLLVALPNLARVEGYVLDHPMSLPLFAGVMVGTLIWLYRRNLESAPLLMYEDGGAEPFVLLRLGGE